MSEMRPLIGLPFGSGSNANPAPLQSYWDAITRGGGKPTFVPLIEDHARLRTCYEQLDGLCLVGGGDVAPERYGSQRPDLVHNIDHTRDWVEDVLAGWALAEDKPVLAICRGVQLLNVAVGGTLYEDIATLVPGALSHATARDLPPGTIAHTIAVEPDSRLAQLLGVTGPAAARVPVNSRHHQALRDVAPGLRVVARAPDGVIEAVEADTAGHPCVVGVQWHPEGMVPEDATMERLFARFCALCVAHP